MTGLALGAARPVRRWEVHTDAVTQVRLQPGGRSVLSGSVDGLLCVIDAAQADVDRAVAAGDGAAADEAKGRKTKAQQDKAVANAEQLALKISANSIYGFTGAVKTNWFCCLGVADSVTYRAREMLYQTVQYVQEFAPCTVVYGDTDSVMVRFHDAKTMQAVADLAEGAATYITNKFPKDIVIEFEKIFHPWILLAKKRYAGLMHEPQDDGTMRFTKLDAKGIELVRRDNCAFAKRIQTGKRTKFRQLQARSSSGAYMIHIGRQAKL